MHKTICFTVKQNSYILFFMEKSGFIKRISYNNFVLQNEIHFKSYWVL
ncbi:hypothetical protein LEP1GSC049_3644 [Leptospira kirschneri serovar Cynopteri str. 3522 CT]|nr:hypothetical protein LEP1GSC044_3504 [Leptospira kirschneri serovar Grippotyphosa str. RM52]EKQ85050.1 hypothetical protein LEP1GSC064_1648 [Leptospira kirschneri serovar Grippotyphosa str. Moskva]EKR06575.1 hypothetical protein LEP1GSC122_0931 [Leptospira kirschneri serovar Valbuzzi str. 200702274]EMJ87379.1 hypothetical protein LEP1GSC198_3720 [Leptospira kirschneri str. JB]EMK02408.1 hypothetical protein LEP1GSC176_3160 [Leptospira kirschneri str. MMD1493]EMK14510.1 hypothetical protein 